MFFSCNFLEKASLYVKGLRETLAALSIPKVSLASFSLEGVQIVVYSGHHLQISSVARCRMSAPLSASDP